MRRLLPVSLLAAALAMAGCGSGPDYVTDRDGVLRLELDEFRVDPEYLRVREGRIRIIARNVGRLTHNVEVQSIEEEETAEPTHYVRLDTMHPGEQAADNVTLGPGKYRLVCTIGNHDDLGQYGELVVTRR
ncbi:hypothetical protein [Conexibacter sp. SYSU D00693]|uniref:hypothetical protein n=1 Tax=Conexibacter sp. SYSU D00693 TaxID=2812560 RepID=UPI00196A530B|nr:hypothetical protein [Conexibacter sp. SYSU D00693]